MNIRDIVRADFEIIGKIDLDFKKVKCNSKEIDEGDLFVAIVGQNSDGHEFIDEAINKGASVIVYEKSRYSPTRRDDLTWIGVEDSRDALAWIASLYYGNPSQRLHLIGITGTNGKTTTSYLVREILNGYGKKTGLIGTIRYLLDKQEIKAPHTTPDALQFQALLDEMLKRGIDYVISEVSSHALSLKRVDYSKFEVAVFTNLSRDHLDFHKDMEEYFLAKKRLFTELLKEDGKAVINIDDEYGKRLAEEIRASKILFSLHNREADLFVKKYKLSFRGTEIEIVLNGETHSIKTELIGIPNVYNTLCAISVALCFGIPMDVIKSSLLNAKAPDGRFENINEGQNFSVFVDYAHTPDALERLLMSVVRLREEIGQTGRIITVFGCGGNRDRGKRPQMGKIASDLSDFVIVTSDNPRWEKPREIIREIEEGITRENYMVVTNREDALKVAVEMCESGDILIVAGKGHEDYQEIEGKRIPFDDREVLRKILRELKR
ncbi:UDP-N-acetylmuramoyl-L-alanyl-D-glutamate--2,6-diaminopimelate ligase [Thermodesulfovibrio sp.]|uniref:UDP-N-acetylmuramoyl-L-alanyl-D-glutamate--2, 6-diaminopimelate ligase n=1 Tax=Thermodesulfovibrio sp. TaxID=2067987 RepID=UPI0030996FFD